MAKKVTGFLKLQVPAGAANPAPPIGPALGQRGLNIMEFCKAFNAQTQKMEKGAPIPVVITIYGDRSFTFEMKTPPMSHFLKKAAKLESGSKTPGRDVAGAEDLVEKVNAGNIDFDRCIATPDMMGLVGRLGKVLGPRGLMPNPRVGTVTMDVANAVKGAKGGSVEFRVESAGILQAGVGKASFSEDKLVENIKALTDAVAKAKPAGSKGTYIQRVAVSSTMGPGVKVEPGTILG